MEFMDWWKVLNEELERMGEPEALYGVARRAYEPELPPTRAAIGLAVARDYARSQRKR